MCHAFLSFLMVIFFAWFILRTLSDWARGFSNARGTREDRKWAREQHKRRKLQRQAQRKAQRETDKQDPLYHPKIFWGTITGIVILLVSLTVLNKLTQGL